MADDERQKDDRFLNSPKEFHLEMPFYHKLDLTVFEIAKRIFELMSYSETMDAYCIWCDRESVFQAHDYTYSHSAFSDWRRKADVFERVSYRCTRDDAHQYFIYYLKQKDVLQKIGQFPSAADFQIPQAEKYRKTLGEKQYKELTRGIGLNAHGVGIGAFVYPRRIFENLIEEAHQQAKKDGEFSEEAYGEARMDEKIQLLQDHLPEFLVENKNLYSILSKGLHELSEEECLEYFQAIKIGIEQILDEKIEK